MPTYRYIGDLEQYYPDRALTVQPGDTAEWTQAPDIHWEPAANPTVTEPPSDPAIPTG